MKTFGATIKEIRKSKGLKIKDVAGEDMTVSLLSKFERGESDITSAKFHKILDRLNVSNDEFMYFNRNLKPNDHKHFLSLLQHLTTKQDIIGLERLGQSQIKKYQETNNVRFLHNSVVTKAHICRLQNKKLENSKKTLISNYLYSVEIWGKYEIELFNNIMFIFEMSELKMLARISVNRMEEYKDLENFKIHSIHLQLNLTLILIEYKDYLQAKVFMNRLRKTITGPFLMFEYCKLVFLEGILDIETNNKGEGIKQCKRAINLLYDFSLYDIANDHMNYLKKYL